MNRTIRPTVDAHCSHAFMKYNAFHHLYLDTLIVCSCLDFLFHTQTQHILCFFCKAKEKKNRIYFEFYHLTTLEQRI